MGFDELGWDLAAPYIELSYDMDQLQDELEDILTPLIHLAAITVFSIATAGAGAAAYAAVFGVSASSFGAVTFGAAFASYGTTLFTTGSTAQAEKAALHSVLTAGVGELSNIPLLDRPHHIRFSIALFEGGIASLEGRDFKQAFLISLSEQYLPGVASFIEALDNTSPFLVDLGVELVGSYIRHDGEWELISGDLENFVLAEAGEYTSNFVNGQLPDSWGQFGDSLGTLAGVALSSDGDPDVIGPAVATELSGLAGQGLGSVFGEESIATQVSSELVDIVLTASLMDPADRPGYIDGRLTVFLFNLAGEEFSSLAEDALISANGGESSALIVWVVGFIDFAVSNAHLDSDEFEAALVGQVSQDLQGLITSQFPGCTPDWVNGLGEQVVSVVFDNVISGNGGDIGTDVVALITQAAETGQIDGADLGTCFEAEGENTPDLIDDQGTGDACLAAAAVSLNAPSAVLVARAFNPSSVVTATRSLNTATAPSTCPSSTDFRSWLVGLFPSAESIANSINVENFVDGQSIVTAKSGFEDRRLVIDGTTGRMQRRDLTPAGNWVTDSGNEVRVVFNSSDDPINFVEPITGDFREWAMGLPSIEATQLFTFSSSFENGVASDIATPLFDSQHRLRLVDDLAVVEERNGSGQWTPEIGALLVVRDLTGTIDGFESAEDGDVSSLFDSFLSLLIGSASAVVQQHLDAIDGCFASIAEHAENLKAAFLELWNSESILAYLAAQWDNIAEIAQIFLEDPAAFTQQFLLDIVRAEEFRADNYARWAGMVTCDIVLILVTAGAGGAAVSTAGRLLSRMPEVRRFRDNANNDASSNPNQNGNLPCNSFPTGTQVRMADGSLQPIEHVEPGDFVLAADPVTGEWSSQLVLDQWSHLDDGHLATAFFTDGSQITATDHHRFWVESSGAWVELDDVAAGDYLLTPNGVTSVAATIIHPVADTLVWELDTAGPDTFTVNTGTSDVLVHNQSTCFINGLSLDQIESAINEYGLEGFERATPEDIDGAWVRYLDRTQNAASQLVPAAWLEAYGRIRRNNGAGNAYEVAQLAQHVGESRVRKNLLIDDFGREFIPDHSEVDGGVLRFVEVKDVQNPLQPSSNLGTMIEFLEDHVESGGRASLHLALSDRTNLSESLRDILDAAEEAGVEVDFLND